MHFKHLQVFPWKALYFIFQFHIPTTCILYLIYFQEILHQIFYTQKSIILYFLIARILWANSFNIKLHFWWFGLISLKQLIKNKQYKIVFPNSTELLLSECLLCKLVNISNHMLFSSNTEYLNLNYLSYFFLIFYNNLFNGVRKSQNHFLFIL